MRKELKVNLHAYSVENDFILRLVAENNSGKHPYTILEIKEYLDKRGLCNFELKYIFDEDELIMDILEGETPLLSIQECEMYQLKDTVENLNAKINHVINQSILEDENKN